jgi:hypothetical protein
MFIGKKMPCLNVKETNWTSVLCPIFTEALFNQEIKNGETQLTLIRVVKLSWSTCFDPI